MKKNYFILSLLALAATSAWAQDPVPNSDEWEVGIPLLLVYIRAKMWLEIYEQHLRTGNEINYYLKSKSKQ